MQSTTGWAFLVARGRYRGYRSLLVPDFLAESGDRSVLTESLDGDVVSAGPPRILSLMTGTAGPITVVFRTHRMTPEDLADSAFDVSHVQPVTDRHGRPLDLLYGFVSRAPGIHAAREGDLVAAKRQALDVYRDFLNDEAEFRTSASHAYPVEVVVERPISPKPRLLPSYAPAPVSVPQRAKPADAATNRRRLIAILVAAAAMLAVLVAVVVIWLALHENKRPGQNGCGENFPCRVRSLSLPLHPTGGDAAGGDCAFEYPITLPRALRTGGKSQALG